MSTAPKTSNDALWKGGSQVFSYSFLDGNDSQHQKVNDALQEWTWYAEVAFRQAESGESSQVSIRFDPSDGSRPGAGRQGGNIDTKDTTITLASVDRSSALTESQRAAILHEFGHTLGILHERQSPAHGGSAVNNTQAPIDLYRKTQGWSLQEVNDQVFNVYSTGDMSNFSQVDPSSIMRNPQPKVVGGLAEDAAYDQKLSSEHQNAPGDNQAGGSTTNNSPPSGPFIKQLYEKLSTLFSPREGQYLALQFPTRSLDKKSYAYELNSYMSHFTKPVLVNEAEFALTDALYPLGSIVGGPNGQSLSVNYRKALNSLIPTATPDSKEVSKQREKIRKWLLKEPEVGNDAAYPVNTQLGPSAIDAQTVQELPGSSATITPGPSANDAFNKRAISTSVAERAMADVKGSGRANPRQMTRIELATELMEQYNNDRKAWELQRDDMIKKASEQSDSDPQAMDKLTRSLAHATAAEQAKLASKYNDAVLRGYGHTTREFMGRSDAKTSAESLQDAKDALRESALSSVYSTSHVYPVAIQPADWFESLDTNFTGEELLQDSEQHAEPSAIETAGKLPLGSEGSNRWSEISIRTSVSDDYTKSASSSSISNFTNNFWIASPSNRASQDEAKNPTAHASTFDIDVAMRVTYVTVGRSGWFDPSILEKSESFTRESNGSSYTRWSTWKNGHTAGDAADAVRNNSEDIPEGYLAAFPVGYVLVKDCVIRVNAGSVDSSSFKSSFDKQVESSSGFLCFSHGGASSTATAEGGIVVRIPGSQILGYMMQLTAEDNTQPLGTTAAEERLVQGTNSFESSFPFASTHGIKSLRAGLDDAEPSAGVRGWDNEGDSVGKTPEESMGYSRPSYSVNRSSEAGPGRMIDALRTALDDEAVADWLRSQPEGTRDELSKKLLEQFGQVKA